MDTNPNPDKHWPGIESAETARERITLASMMRNVYEEQAVATLAPKPADGDAVVDLALLKDKKIKAVLRLLQEAGEIDERDQEYTLSFLRSWYDSAIADTTNIKVIAGAMTVELMKRRGELHDPVKAGRRVIPRMPLSEEECESVTHIPTSPSERTRIKEERIVASEPEAVDEYVQQAVAANRAASKRGAVRVAQAAKQERLPAVVAVLAEKRSWDRQDTVLRNLARHVNRAEREWLGDNQPLIDKMESLTAGIKHRRDRKLRKEADAARA